MSPRAGSTYSRRAERQFFSPGRTVPWCGILDHQHLLKSKGRCTISGILAPSPTIFGHRPVTSLGALVPTCRFQPSDWPKHPDARSCRKRKNRAHSRLPFRTWHRMMMHVTYPRKRYHLRTIHGGVPSFLSNTRPRVKTAGIHASLAAVSTEVAKPSLGGTPPATERSTRTTHHDASVRTTNRMTLVR